MKKPNAFTLAEVLITLAIMGVLMAITIPVLLQNTFNNSYIDGLKKTYSVLNQATNQIMMQNSGTMQYAFSSSTDAQTKYGNVLELNATCAAGANTGTCWANSSNGLFGGAALTSGSLAAGTGFTPNTGYTGAVLADGTTLLFYIPNTACDGTGVSVNLPYSSDPNHLCGYIIVDVNGLNPPNIFGKDMFMFLLGPGGIIPGGDPHTIYSPLNSTGNCNTTNKTQNGYGCAAQILNAQAMNFST